MAEIFQNTLEQCMDEIQSDIKTRLLTAISESKLDSKSIIRGDKDKSTGKEFPQTWLFVERMTPNHDVRTLAEKWVMDLVLFSMCTSLVPEDGHNLANKLSCQARIAAIKGRTLNRQYVHDVKSGVIEPSLPGHKEKNVYTSSATVHITFFVYEDVRGT